MLDDHEQRTLHDIQRQLTLDDPEFTRNFRALAAAPAPPRTYTVLVAVAMTLAVVSLLTGSVGGALAFGVLTATVWFARHLEQAVARRAD